LAFTWLKLSGIYPPELASVNLDIDWFYRHLIPRTLRSVSARVKSLDAAMRNATLILIRFCIQGIAHFHGPRGLLARTWDTGNMVLLVIALLGILLIFNYLWLSRKAITHFLPELSIDINF
jgi:multicomponent Na+:H+ antiporter subunit D